MAAGVSAEGACEPDAGGAKTGFRVSAKISCEPDAGAAGTDTGTDAEVGAEVSCEPDAGGAKTGFRVSAKISCEPDAGRGGAGTGAGSKAGAEVSCELDAGRVGAVAAVPTGVSTGAKAEARGSGRRFMMPVYYNEIEPFAAAWLRNLISAGHLPKGDVDERSIVDVRKDDLRGYRQCHFFAGIGGWPYALKLAGWPEDRPAWTGSCPCQPLSSAGQRKGHADERHLWPAFYDLISECEPAAVFGEQVASKDGREWFAAVRADLEQLGYACGGANLPAAGVGAPHIRQRLWWVADSPGNGGGAGTGRNNGAETDDGGGMGDTQSAGLERRELGCNDSGQNDSCEPWSRSEFIPCSDGKARPTEPGILPLVNGFPGRVGRVRAYGNAIVPQVAAVFIQAAMNCLTGDL